MAKPLQEWVATDVKRVSGSSMRWLSGEFFFRDPLRPQFIELVRIAPQDPSPS